MCLTVPHTQKFKTAEEDLVFYKLLRPVVWDGKTVWESPIQATPVKIGEEMVCEGEVEKVVNRSAMEVDGTVSYSVEIGRGVFHLYRHLTDAVFVKHMTSCEIFKAIVPKGTEYIEGKHLNYGCFVNSIGARKVIYQPLDK